MEDMMKFLVEFAELLLERLDAGVEQLELIADAMYEDECEPDPDGEPQAEPAPEDNEHGKAA